jgi:hypothetical protein
MRSSWASIPSLTDGVINWCPTSGAPRVARVISRAGFCRSRRATLWMRGASSAASTPRKLKPLRRTPRCPSKRLPPLSPTELHQDVQDHLSSYRGKIAETVREQLSILLEEEIARQVRPGPGCSNRKLADMLGVSIREVKRRRRRQAERAGPHIVRSI